VSTNPAVNPVVISAIRTYFPIVSAIVVGLIVGAIGHRVVQRRQGIPASRTILSAIAGAFGGTAIAALAGVPTWGLLFQVGMAVLAVVVVTPAYRRRFARH
jgi:uncharacterized membrane protein YeaQ/YmgE (transglycosylase-associated protein family)